VSLVIAIDECPSRLLTTAIDTPAASIKEA